MRRGCGYDEASAALASAGSEQNAWDPCSPIRWRGHANPGRLWVPVVAGASAHWGKSDREREELTIGPTTLIMCASKTLLRGGSVRCSDCLSSVCQMTLMARPLHEEHDHGSAPEVLHRWCLARAPVQQDVACH